MHVYAKELGVMIAMSESIWHRHIATNLYPSGVAVNYLKKELASSTAHDLPRRPS